VCGRGGVGFGAAGGWGVWGWAGRGGGGRGVRGRASGSGVYTGVLRGSGSGSFACAAMMSGISGLGRYNWVGEVNLLSGSRSQVVGRT
jgi:hypothetical protein